MAGGIAHDFNLLQSILGNIELASLHLILDAPAHKFIDNAMSSAKKAALLNGLVLIYVGKGMVAKKNLNLNELVRINADMLGNAASSAVSIELNLSPELPVIVADEAHIQQVVMSDQQRRRIHHGSARLSPASWIMIKLLTPPASWTRDRNRVALSYWK